MRAQTSIPGFRGQTVRKPKEKENPKENFLTMKSQNFIAKPAPRIQRIQSAKIRKNQQKEWDEKRTEKLFSEHEKIGKTEPEKIQSRSDREAIISSMIKQYANLYPQNQQILRNIVQANIRKVELSDTQNKAKEKINTVIQECMVFINNS